MSASHLPTYPAVAAGSTPTAASSLARWQRLAQWLRGRGQTQPQPEAFSPAQLLLWAGGFPARATPWTATGPLPRLMALADAPTQTLWLRPLLDNLNVDVLELPLDDPDEAFAEALGALGRGRTLLLPCWPGAPTWNPDQSMAHAAPSYWPVVGWTDAPDSLVLDAGNARETWPLERLAGLWPSTPSLYSMWELAWRPQDAPNAQLPPNLAHWAPMLEDNLGADGLAGNGLESWLEGLSSLAQHPLSDDAGHRLARLRLTLAYDLQTPNPNGMLGRFALAEALETWTQAHPNAAQPWQTAASRWREAARCWAELYEWLMPADDPATAAWRPLLQALSPSHAQLDLAQAESPQGLFGWAGQGLENLVGALPPLPPPPPPAPLRDLLITAQAAELNALRTTAEALV